MAGEFRGCSKDLGGEEWDIDGTKLADTAMEQEQEDLIQAMQAAIELRNMRQRSKGRRCKPLCGCLGDVGASQHRKGYYRSPGKASQGEDTENMGCIDILCGVR